MKTIKFTAETATGKATLSFQVNDETMEVLKKDLIEKMDKSLYSVYSANHSGEDIVVSVDIDGIGCVNM